MTPESGDPLACPDLTSLVERLKDARFRVDTRQYLLANELLLALAARGEALDRSRPDRYVSCLGPLFCTSVDEQRRFAGIVADWLKTPASTPDGFLPEPGRAVDQRSVFTLWHHWRWRIRIGVAAVPVLFVTMAAACYYNSPIEVAGAVVRQPRSGPAVPASDAQVLVDGVTVVVGADGRFTVRVRRGTTHVIDARLGGYRPARIAVSGATESAKLTLIEEEELPVVADVPRATTATAPLPVVLPGSVVAGVTDWRTLISGGLMTGCIAWVAAWILARTRRQFALRRLPVHEDPELVTLHPEAPQLPPDRQHALTRTAIALRRPREQAAQALDAKGTVEDTVRAGGFFQPRLVAVSGIPEYLALVGRRGPDDHQAHAYEDVLDIVRNYGVHLDVYWFHDDPRTCYDTRGRGHSLAKLASVHHRATLIVCADSITAFNKHTAALSPWVEVTKTFQRRVYFVPEAPFHWSELESTLAGDGFIVLPATDAGWRQLSELEGTMAIESIERPYARSFPPLIASHESRWMDRNEPPVPAVEKLVRQLSSFLGAAGFEWLCACAVYPQISWPLTQQLRGANVSPSVLPSLVRLPWLRYAFMPDWLRVALIARMPFETASRVRLQLLTLLEDMAGAPTAVGTSSSDLAIGLTGPIDLLRNAPQGSPLNDNVLVGFLSGPVDDPLVLPVGAKLLEGFRRRPGAIDAEPAAGSPRSSAVTQWIAQLRAWNALHPERARLVASAMLAVAAMVPLGFVQSPASQPSDPATFWFVEVPAVRLGTGYPAGDGRPQQTRSAPPFFISRTEVTVGQYKTCVREGACNPSDQRAVEGPDDWPVRFVTWQEAKAFCAWLDVRLRGRENTPRVLADVLSGRFDETRWSVDLPSEPEWESAARGREQWIYPWGDTADALRANFATAGRGGPTAVGSFPSGQSPYGVLDMGGNVSEWTRTGIDGVSLDGPEATVKAANLDVAVRGGSFSSPAQDIDVRNTSRQAALSRSETLGFRVVVSSREAPLNNSSTMMTPLSLQSLQNAPLDWLTSPPRDPLTAASPFTGDEVPLRLGSQVFALRAQFRESLPTRGNIATSVLAPVAVHVLITGSYVVNIASGQTIGRITLQFTDGSASFDLVNGDNLREGWEYADAITELRRFGQGAMVQNVWSERQYRGDRAALAYLDMFSMRVPQRYRNSTLTGIVFEDADVRLADKNSQANIDPSVIVTAVTVESRPVPAKLTNLRVF